MQHSHLNDLHIKSEADGEVRSSHDEELALTLSYLHLAATGDLGSDRPTSINIYARSFTSL